MKALEARYKTTADFLKFYMPRTTDISSGTATELPGIFLKSFLAQTPRGRVMVDIEVDSIMERCCLEGVVVDGATTLQVGGRAIRGAIVQFLPDESSEIERLLCAVEQDVAAYQGRSLKRTVASIEVECDALEDGALLTEDFSPGGVFIVTNHEPIKGQLLQLRIVAPDYGVDRVVVGEVAWLGSKEGHQGAGVRFVFKSNSERREWQAIYTRVQRLRQRRLTDAALVAAAS